MKDNGAADEVLQRPTKPYTSE